MCNPVDLRSFAEPAEGQDQHHGTHGNGNAVGAVVVVVSHREVWSGASHVREEAGDQELGRPRPCLSGAGGGRAFRSLLLLLGLLLLLVLLLL